MSETLQTIKNILPKVLLNIIAEYASEYIFIVNDNMKLENKVNWYYLQKK